MINIDYVIHMTYEKYDKRGNMSKEKRLNLRIENDLYLALEKKCQKLNIDVSTYCRHVLFASLMPDSFTFTLSDNSDIEKYSEKVKDLINEEISKLETKGKIMTQYNVMKKIYRDLTESKEKINAMINNLKYYFKEVNETVKETFSKVDDLNKKEISRIKKMLYK